MWSTIHNGKRKKAVPAKPRKRTTQCWLITRRDGREILNLKTVKGCTEYLARIIAMAERQEGTCSICKELLVNATFEHEDLRGMGGGRRDDRIEVNGKWQNSAACFWCNSIKGSRRK